MSEQNKQFNYIAKLTKLKWIFIILGTLIFLSFYIPVPFYITYPGSAIDLENLIEVNNGYESEGSFMLTTIAMYPGTFAALIYSQFNPYMDLVPKTAILIDEESPEDYTKRQIEVMEESQENAIIAAFNYLDLPIEIRYKGILVMGLISGTPNEKKLKIGDLITNVDNIQIKKLDQLFTYFEQKNVGETIELDLIRDSKTIKQQVTLISLAESENDDLKQETKNPKVGIGFYPYEDRQVTPSKEITFNTEEIGGPSAGLMFTLELINQLTQNDLTKGYQIAGTGTINEKGEIGQIGGANLKVKAAYNKKAEIFFVPKDLTSFDTNQKDAEEINNQLGKKLKVVPVVTLNEAINYLNALPPKR